MAHELGPRANRVYAALLERISGGHLAPGAKLPSHLQLAAEFGVAPMTVRLVLGRLEEEGLVSREPGRGTFVRAPARAAVLVVDDDAPARIALGEYVTRAGYRPIAASGPADGLAALKRDPTIALVLSDVRMPTAADGTGFIRAVRRRWPELPLAAVTGYAEDLADLRGSPECPVLIVPKPFRPSQVEEALRLALTTPYRPAQVDATTARPGPTPSAVVLADRYLAAQLAGDRRAALRVAVEDGIERGLPIPDLYLAVIQPAQYRIGQLWQDNQITVAQEHLATAISQLALAQVYPALPRDPSNGKRALVACVAGELHDLGARMTADFFEMAGFGVRYLGADVPTDSLVAMAREDPPDLLVLSVTMSFHLDTLRDAVRRLRETLGHRSRLAVGGHAFTWAPGLESRLGADVYGRDARESVGLARRVLGLDGP